MRSSIAIDAILTPMKQKLGLLLFTVLVGLGSGCTTLKRYNSIEPSGTDNNLADIDLFGLKLSRAKPENMNKTLWDLSADAQSQYIKILNSRYPDNEQFLQAMSFKYLKEDETLPPDDYVSKDLRLIFSVSKLRDYGKRYLSSGFDLSPADRIEYLKISLTIPEDTRLRFTGWNMFSTEYGSVEIADISFSRNIELSPSGFISAENGESGGEISTGGKSSVSRKEDQEIKYRYLKLNGRINKYKIEIEEEGVREIDLTGNISADVSLEFERSPEIMTAITGLQDSSGMFNDPDKLMIRHTEAMIPSMENSMDTIYAELSMAYVFRNVLNGRKTFPEWDDRIKYYTGSITKTIPLFVSGDYVPEFYCIGINNTPDRRDLLKVSSPGKMIYSIIFKNYSEASAFCEWLNNWLMKTENKGNTLRIGEHTMKFMDNDVTGQLISDFSKFRIMPYFM